MRQKLLLLLNFVLLSAWVQAAPVDVNEAKAKALQFVSGKQAAARSTVQSSPEIQLAAAADDSYFVFNVGQQDGFVIVSGDDRAPEILGYSDSGAFDEQNVPDNMKAWLQGYASEIQQLDRAETAAARSSVREASWAAIEPLIQTKWDQHSPYNDNLNGCVTGCVATAMAQVMYYHRWPQEATTAIPAYGSRSSLPATSFDWSSMKTVYTGAESTTANEAVAKLMQYCGYSVEMSYGTGSSSASERMAATALTSYFDYDEGVRYLERIYYTIDEWETIIYEELRNNRPVLYGGSTVSGSGHEFVCDGYDGNGLFHFNWGWGGRYNGFFVLWGANPKGTGTGGGASGDGYSVRQSAIIGIQKPTGQTPDEEEKKLTVREMRVYNNQLTYTRSSLQENFTVSICDVVGNATSSPFSVYLGIGLFGDNNYSRVISYASGGTVTPGAFYNLSGNSYSYYNYSFGAGLTGTYRLVSISREASSSTWLRDGMSDQRYIEAVMTETTLTLRVMPTVNLTVTNVEYTGNKMAGIPQEVKVTVRNDGMEYNDKLFLVMNNNTGYSSAEQVALRAGEETDVYFHYTPSSAGTDTYHIGTGTSSSTWLKDGVGTQTIAAYSATSNIDLDMTMTINSRSKGTYLFGNTLSVTVTAINTSSQVYSGGVGFYHDGNINYANVTIIPGQAYNFDYSMSIATNTSYSLSAIQSKNGGWGYTPVTYTAAEGVEVTLPDGTTEMALATPTFEVPADVTSVDLRGVSSVTSLNTNGADPNCLYLMDENATVSGVTKNVIKGTTAASIELTDGADFAAPIDFKAAEISYERQFEAGTDGSGSGWTTIVLPFDVQKVTVDGRDIDWFHSSSETGKHFWLRELVSDREGGVTFDYVDELKANTPYIIAVPGSKWGSNWNLTGKTLKFVGKSQSQIVKDAVAETARDHYSFVGTTKSQALTNVYALDDAGKTFKRGDATIAPFRAYFSAISGSRATKLDILSLDDQPTAISLPDVEPLQAGDVYTLDGRKVGTTLDGLPKGIYVVNGKKVVK